MSKNTRAKTVKDDNVSQKKKIKTTELNSIEELQSLIVADLTDPPAMSPRATITAAATAAATTADTTSDPSRGIQYNSGQKIGRNWKIGDLQMSTGYYSGEPMLKIAKGNIWKSGYQIVFLTAAEYFELRALLTKMLMRNSQDVQIFKLGTNNAAAAVEIDNKRSTVTISACYMDAKAFVNLSAEEFAAFDKALNSFWYPMKLYYNNPESTMVIHLIFQLSALLIVSSMNTQCADWEEDPESADDERYVKLFNNAYTDMNNFSMCTTVLDKVQEKHPQASVKMNLFTLFFQCISQIEILKDYVALKYYEK